MSPTVFAIVLFAAALHATWNAVVKGGVDKFMTTTLVMGSAAGIALVLLPFLPPIAPASWPYVIASTVFQIGYSLLVARIYSVADMSQTYPVMRGTAPLLVAVISVFLLAQPLLPLAWIGVAIICGGIFVMAAGRRQGQGLGIALALVNATVIAGYTLIDGAGVRLSGAPATYTLWGALLNGIPLVIWALYRRGGEVTTYAKAHWRLGLLGGIGTTASYGLALWAMTQAPVAVVAALRETSILFGAVISVMILKEKISPARIVAAVVIAIGAVVLRLA